MLRDCVWSRFGQLSTFQKDLSPAARKKWSEDRNLCLWSGYAMHSLVLFCFPKKMGFFLRKNGTLRMGGALGGKGKGLCFFSSSLFSFDPHSCT